MIWRLPRERDPQHRGTGGTGRGAGRCVHRRGDGMSEVVPIEARQPHVAETAQCRACRHSWVAVIISTANMWLLQCPSCGLMHGHIPHARPNSPFEAKVWAEEMWTYWYEGAPPKRGVVAQHGLPPETDGSAGFAGEPSTNGGRIMTVNPSRWTTYSLSGLVETTQTTTCEQPTSGATTSAALADGEEP